MHNNKNKHSGGVSYSTCNNLIGFVMLWLILFSLKAEYIWAFC